VPPEAQAARGLRRLACLLALILLMLAAVLSVMSIQRIAARPMPMSVHPPTLLQVEQLAELVTTRVAIADVRETKIAGYLGDVKAVLIVRGEALLGPDLSKASVSTNEQARQITISLPRPHVISCHLEHSGTRLVCLSHDGLWALVPGDAGRTAVLNRAYREAEIALTAAAMTPATVEQAGIQAQRVLGSFFAAIGWRVTVRWANN
jgi:hypothetical protein